MNNQGICRVNSRRGILMSSLMVLVFLIPGMAAAWVADPAVNSPVALADYAQIQADTAADGKGGVYIVWRDDREGGASNDVFAQHIDATGRALWAVNGVKVADTSANYLRVVLDGNKGLIVGWLDSRNGAEGVYAQRLNAAGVAQWTPDGVALNTASSKYPLDLHLIADGQGGAIATWTLEFSVTDTDVYAQKVDASGAVKWTAAAKGVSTLGSTESEPRLISDGAGGAFFVWEDSRNESNDGNSDIYAQHLDASGAYNWSGGLAVTQNTSPQFGARLVSDGQGGMIVAYLNELQLGVNAEAVRVSDDGSFPWVAARTIAASANQRRNLQIVADGGGGIVAVWGEIRSNSETGIYAQRLDANGTTKWPLKPVRDRR